VNPRATRAQVGGRQRDVTPVLNSFFVTHPDSVRALLRVESFPGSIWEPAVGDGTMAHVLAEGTDVRNVVASDLVDRGSNLPGFFTHDFLGPGGCVGIDHVVTNPPFELGERFVVKALSLDVPGKVAMFLRLAWLEGRGRHRRIWSTRPPARVWVFSGRQPLRRNGGEWQTGLIAFGWFVWERETCDTRLGWLPWP